MDGVYRTAQCHKRQMAFKNEKSTVKKLTYESPGNTPTLRHPSAEISLTEFSHG